MDEFFKIWIVFYRLLFIIIHGRSFGEGGGVGSVEQPKLKKKRDLKTC